MNTLKKIYTWFEENQSKILKLKVCNHLKIMRNRILMMMAWKIISYKI